MRPGSIMASATPAKIVLKSSTKVSLNDRFTNIMKTRPVTTAGVRAQVASDRLASERNRRLAQQMERRPSVAAEIGNRPVGSVRDRLGSAPTRRFGGRHLGRGGRFQTRGQFTRGAGRGAVRNTRGRNPVGRRGFARGTPTRGTTTRMSRGASARGRGRGRGGRQARGGATRQLPANRESLDEQLDDYMTKTKGAMNAELDSYMAEINK